MRVAREVFELSELPEDGHFDVGPQGEFELFDGREFLSAEEFVKELCVIGCCSHNVISHPLMAM